MSNHAGLGATAPHEIRNEALTLSFIESDDQKVECAWRYLLDAYREMLEVFLDVTAGLIDPTEMLTIRQEIGLWKERVARILQQSR